MIKLADVSYVRLGTRDLEGATHFATGYLGLDVAERAKGAVYFKSDEREHTLCYVEGDPADQAVGFEVEQQGDLDVAAAQLETLGHAVARGSQSDAALRKVRDFISFRDPSGNRIELAWRPGYSGRRYHGQRDAGVTGFSHVGLCSTDLVRDEAFWTQVTNAQVSDRIGDAPLLRIDEVHHTIALFPSAKPGIQHINHQVETGDDIMRSFNFLKQRQVKMVFGPGRHPTSSAKFLYFEGPDGMVFEYSSGVREIADELLWRERQFVFEPKGFCKWGAKPAIAEFNK
ncbi:VOC family protein [Bradyrhizobium sp. U87765 SZCCT0131]|uniref:VOC family protein n=1 Tax=unclassified Bradyrhizobium TaxID=2631580 RepID=UPI001BA74FFD|nr:MULTISPECIES: VOC family protein [unclassified Bradyrhizobium]MBR1219792.1 VOC family protein [Bradyrhizobium sp. U87765 SZCCT0131]MBR1262443.1 VOC family protein [Bradyrhizobium sp. U87765 SZCCT0134]MBR1308374.1 VOC family protein [Bradyrhizobium sp. U87765 SZCCT0110]MBR1318225.1 VOC family protein [Bradyrhizobium sp. U87765 SZCCT0109]MBR1351928.1 VOC family protein [Bradyrhizobium sp. U87765 SZCCT0048]